MIVVVDASVAVKWFVEEDRRELARGLLSNGIVRVAPDLILTEVASALRKKVSSGEVLADQARIALTDLVGSFSTLIPADATLGSAFEISLALTHPLGDCAYLACAQLAGGCLVTDDRKLLAKVEGTEYEQLTVGLETWTAPDLPQENVSILVDSTVLDRLVRLSTMYQETKAALGKGSWRGDADILANHYLVAELRKMDRNSIAHLISVCWLGFHNFHEYEPIQLLKSWKYHLAHAATTIGNESVPDFTYIISKLQFLELGLDKISRLSQPSGQV